MSTPSRIPSISLLVLNWNGRTLLESCLPPLLAQEYVNFHVLMVDNASEDESVAYVREAFPAVEILQNEQNLGFAGGVNVGLRHLQARRDDYVILLNTDVVVPAGWLPDFVAAIESVANLGVAGCKLVFPDGRIQHLGAELSWPLAHGQHFHMYKPDFAHEMVVQDCGYVTGAVFAISVEALSKVPLFDEQFYPFYLEEVDYCKQVRDAGLRVVVVPSVEAVHDESSSMNKVGGAKMRAVDLNRLRYIVKHYSLVQFLDEFVPAERVHLRGQHSAEQYQSRRLAYLEMLLELPERLAPAGRSADVAVMQAAFIELRDYVITLEPFDNQIHDENGKRLLEMGKRREIEEFDFASSSPIVGKLRSAWHDVAGRYALRYAMQQQADFNEHVGRMLDGNMFAQETDGREIGRLLNELIALKARVAELEGKDE